MRALLVMRPDAAAKPGGDVVVAERTAEALRAAGVDADLVATSAPDARGYDVAHVFGIFEPEFARPQFGALRASGTPVVLSPIWWDRTAFFVMSPRLERALRGPDPARAARRIAELREAEERLCARPGRGALRRRAEQAELLRACDVALPASEIEAFACANGLRAPAVPYVVAPYGVDDDAFAAERGEERSGVLCIGRIEPLKNQAGLLFALRDADVEITLLGRAYDADYLALCKRWATPRTRFVERIPREELRALLARTAVHVLPSWADLPGFVSLEAAAAGARVVAGTRGSEREYLGPDVAYVDPLDPDGIRDAVLRALERPARDRGDALERRLGARTWQQNAAMALDAYARAVAARR
ncbi:MAG TPA: glycosyltransferase [Candidatus Elarobacter sp.]|nr:glycosyltransferase [Candidatus Elarobacter sp.]